MRNSSSRIRGFTLIELLVVMLIIGIIATFLVPAVGTILRGSQLNQASQLMFDQFSLARQMALTTNHPIEVRLIQYPDPESPGEVLNGNFVAANGHFRAVQLMTVLDAIDPQSQPADFVRVPVDKPQLFPQGVVMDSPSPFPGQGPCQSTLLQDYVTGGQQASDATPTTSPFLQTSLTKGKDPEMPRGVGLNYMYVAFRFMPDGSTNLPANSVHDKNGAWFVTLHNLTDPMGQATPPANFFTLQIDPIMGTLKQFRPGLVN